MAKLMKSLLCGSLVAGVCWSAASAVAVLPAVVSECDTTNKVVFERTDTEFHVRTMVVEDSDRQRMLVLTDSVDVSRPCQLRWWLDHNPQGVVQCRADAGPAEGPGAGSSATRNLTTGCPPGGCLADASRIELGYVRTMLVSALYVPGPPRARLSAICVALGCRTRITKTRIPGDALLEERRPQPEANWAPRPSARRILVIGLGSSTMALWLRHNLPDTELHVAELLPSVAAAAPCFGLEGDPKLHIHVGDGRQFLAGSADGTYDSILVDAFDDNASLPVCFRTQNFFGLARRKLAPGGSLVLNLLLSGKDSLRVLRSLTSHFNDDRVYVGDAPGAEGIQNIVTAFAPVSLRASGNRAQKVSPPTQAASWFAAARFRPLRVKSYNGAAPLEDSATCPGALWKA